MTSYELEYSTDFISCFRREKYWNNGMIKQWKQKKTPTYYLTSFKCKTGTDFLLFGDNAPEVT